MRCAGWPPARPRTPDASVTLRGHLLWLVVIAMVPALLFSAALIYLSAQEREEALKADIEGAARLLAREVEAELQRTTVALEVLAVSNALVTDDLEQFHGLCRRALDTHPDWANIVVAGADAQHLLNLMVPYGSPLPPLSRPELFHETAERRAPVISNAIVGVLTHRLLTVVTLPVVRDDKVVYILAVAQEARNWETLLRARLPAGMHATLVDRNGTVIARTLENARFAGKAAPSVLLKEVARNPEQGGVAGEALDGSIAHGAYRQVGLSGWTVAAFTPIEMLQGPPRRRYLQLGVGFFVLIAGSLAVAWLLARRIAGSIRRLATSVRAVGRGHRPLRFDGRIREVREAGKALQDAAALLAERLEREKAARAGLEAADRAKDQYLAMLAHELRNPLAPISASLYILAEEPLSSDAARRARAVIARQTGHLSRLVDDLLDVTRLASGKVALHMQEIALDDALRQAIDDHRSLAEGAGVQLALELPSSPVRVRGDRTRLAQMIGNLIQNAVRFTPDGGRVSVSLEQRDSEAEIRVRDTGSGIEPHILERVFEPFVQGAQAATRARGGLGLGLALVKGLAELHGGRVHARNIGPGQGAEFSLVLPVLRAGRDDGPERPA